MVRQCTGGGRFAGIDVADNDDIDVNLFFTVMRREISKICLTEAQ